MKKSYQLKNLGCANCAAKMESGIKKLEGVSDARVNFMISRLTLEAEDSRFDEILEKAAAVCKKYEPDCKIIK